MIKLKPIAQQVIVITGASSGIGVATARRAAAKGARVLLVARNEPVLRTIVEEITACGGRAEYAVADVGDLGQLSRAAEVALEMFGRIDTWVSNAGVAIYSDLLATPRIEHERLFQTNYWGAVNSAQVAVPHLRASGGALITVGSIAAAMGSPVMGAYAATKHAVRGYVDSLRIELNRDKVPVVVTLIKPSGIDTPLNAHVANHRTGRAKIPPPVYAPELVAETILHAAAHPTREVTIGGVGVLQVLTATHLPALFARLAGAITPLLNDSKASGPSRDNLFLPLSDAKARGDNAGRRFSVYTTARLHPGAPLAAGLAVGVTVLVTTALRRR